MKKMVALVVVAMSFLTVATAQTKVTFQIDMSEVEGKFKAPEIHGNINDWAGPIKTEHIGDGIYEAKVKIKNKKPGDKIYWGARYWKINKNVLEDIPKECGGSSQSKPRPGIYRTSVVPEPKEIYRWKWSGCRVDM
ncbi:hypothetical protein [Reichenbachiella versicolor]|uniref:hypothetical protein n=1 Tax=Reichenbachiella versicolor TaxID=1821036 RepID=UPI000D6DDFC3|nr:hypothetical protein [Reichenbachiella versicolor]